MTLAFIYPELCSSTILIQHPRHHVVIWIPQKKKKSPNIAILLKELPKLQPLTPKESYRTDPCSRVDDKVLGIPNSSSQLSDLSLQLLWFVTNLGNKTEQFHVPEIEHITDPEGIAVSLEILTWV